MDPNVADYLARPTLLKHRTKLPSRSFPDSVTATTPLSCQPPTVTLNVPEESAHRLFDVIGLARPLLHSRTKTFPQQDRPGNVSTLVQMQLMPPSPSAVLYLVNLPKRFASLGQRLPRQLVRLAGVRLTRLTSGRLVFK